MERGYDTNRPHKKQYYPNSYKESKIIEKKMKHPDLEYFKLTDKTPRTAFTKYLDSKGLEYDVQELKNIISDSYSMIIGMKKYYNRPRPFQINENIKPLKSQSASTPAYPSGHAFQSYLIAKHLSRKYPLHTFNFYSIANRISRARVSAGLHYPSDNRKAFELAHKL